MAQLIRCRLIAQSRMDLACVVIGACLGLVGAIAVAVILSVYIAGFSESEHNPGPRMVQDLKGLATYLIGGNIVGSVFFLLVGACKDCLLLFFIAQGTVFFVFSLVVAVAWFIRVFFRSRR